MIETLYILSLIALIIVYIHIYKNQACYVEAYDQKFLVRNLDDKKKAALIMYKLRTKLLNFIKELCEDFDNNNIEKDKLKFHKFCKTIRKKLPYTIFKEASSESNYTSYSINKGETLVMCIRSKETNEIHDFDLLMYVAVHEIAHIGCPEIGHTPLFNLINEFLLKEASKRKYYTYKDYSIDPKEYCGIEITSNIIAKYMRGFY